MSELIETKEKSVLVDPRMPVVSIILMAIALIIEILSPFAFGIVSGLNLLAFPLLLAGMILHKKNLQVLTGIGALIIAVLHLYYVFRDIGGFINGYVNLSFFGIFVNLLTAAAYIVSGLHYVLRKGRPGRVGKLILMIILIFFGLISLFLNLITYIEYGVPLYMLLAVLPSFLSSFAMMFYTPFRRV